MSLMNLVVAWGVVVGTVSAVVTVLTYLTRKRP